MFLSAIWKKTNKQTKKTQEGLSKTRKNAMGGLEVLMSARFARLRKIPHNYQLIIYKKESNTVKKEGIFSAEKSNSGQITPLIFSALFCTALSQSELRSSFMCISNIGVIITISSTSR